MAEKVTVMVLVLKVDLECSCCYKKAKKVLCKFPQIRDQVYDVKQNTVRITVVCCNPEKMRDKLYCKGRKVITIIKIDEPQKPEDSRVDNPSKPTPPTTGGVCCGPCHEGYGWGLCYPVYGRPVPPPPASCYDGYGYEYQYRYGYGYAGYKSCCVSNYFSEENPQGCTIM